MLGDVDPVLPALREELALERGGTLRNGAPSWLIHDPMRNRFFRIGNDVKDLLAHWRAIGLKEFCHGVSGAVGREVPEEEITELVQFLFQNELTQSPPSGKSDAYLTKANMGKHGVLATIAHRYLFFRIPLTRPQPFLDATWPLVSPLFTRTAVWLYLLLGCLSLYLVTLQWDVFVSTFMDLLSVEGFVLYGLSLVFIKICHELGHAYMATKYRMPVPVIGVAFLVLMPILYTDTSNAWMLKDKRKRLMIDMAGIYTELVLAVMATTLWIFLPDGPARSIAFTTATLSWVISLAVNLNPFMRFDGYYILSDALGFENLQDRGFALAKWRLREFLFGLRKPAPEWLPQGQRRFIIAHAFGTWIYRFFLFLGIALLVYHFFIKVVAVVLFVVEIIWFIALPIWRELKEWWKMRDEILKTRRTRWSGIAMCIGFLMLVVPWSSRVDVPAMVLAANSVQLHPRHAGQLVELTIDENKSVKQGELLARLASPEVEQEKKLALQRIELLRTRLNRITADRQERDEYRILSRELEMETERLVSLTRQTKDLEIRAPFDGVIVDMDAEVSTGIWLGVDRPLATLRTRSGIKIEGLLNEADLDRIGMEARGKFIPDDPGRSSFPVSVLSIADISQSEFLKLDFAEPYGGKVPVVAADMSGMSSGAPLRPRGGWYRLQLQPTDTETAPEGETTVRGVVVLEGQRESYLTMMIRRVASVLVRELGI